ncbi:alkaline dihydroceramidase [Pichia kluyveri]|uniref:Alkaline dihydroceramidase n=1 Tax=Pichia kluyveri TaxID=36015 RepID=A0AAV5R7U3_PICKL|nr:alkaline dihydroceramidase [Pichia kluyveri]
MFNYPTESFEPFWGPPTATIDWCEENYLFTPYIAEVINAFTNVFFVLLALHHIYSTFKNNHGVLYIFISIGFASVGIGSFMFHSTLHYEHQLMDELPMVWVTAIPFGYIWGWDKPQPWNFIWNCGTLLLTSIFTYTYIFIYRNPAFHQIFYAALNFGVIYKSIKTMNRVIPDKEIRHRQFKLLGFSFSLFAFGFLIWNLDNVYCSNLISWRRNYLGWPFGIILEGHGWWHIFTGLGIYYFIIYNMINSVYMRGEGNKYTIKRFGFLVEVQKINDKKLN